jgi:hypothetical protein
MKFFSTLLSSNGWLLMLLYFLSAFLINLTDTTFVNTDIVFAKYIQEKADSKYNQNDEYIKDFEEDLNEMESEESSTFDLVGILWDAFFILLEITLVVPLIAAMIVLGFVLQGNDSGADFASIVKITMLSYFIFLFPDVISLVWFIFIQPEFRLEDLINFNPLSILNLLPTIELPGWLFTLLRPINLFEAGFVLSLSYGLHITYGLSWPSMIKRVLLFYVGSLYTWKIVLLYISYLL